MAISALAQRVLIIGGSGQLGRELREAFADTVVTAPPHGTLDIERSDEVAAVLRESRPTLVINTSAFHHVETCETMPERAFAVNALAVDRLAAAAAVAGAAFATFSTDYVFDGTAARPYVESDATGPLSAYGSSKLAGEHLTRRHGERHFIVRTGGLYGRIPSPGKGYTFVDRILTQAAAGEPVRVVDDIVLSPSYAVDVALAVRGLVDAGAFGTYHVTNAGECSWFDFASEALRLAGSTVVPERTSSRDFAAKVRRPLYSPLAHEGLARAGLPPMRDWRGALAAYVAGRNDRSILPGF